METYIAPPAIAGESIEVTGSVKWFDLAKGYGFIKPAAGPQGDILLHQSCVRQSGFKIAQEGARVTCEAVQGPKGLQARRLLALDNSMALTVPSAAQRPVRFNV
ncbi:MAG TPA: cold shock domain-containing protein, partial [Rhizomicrobium sp.]